MTDKKESRIAMIASGVSYKEIVDALGISRNSLYNKLNNKSDFRQVELIKLFDLLKLDTWEKRQAIFFADAVN